MPSKTEFFRNLGLPSGMLTEFSASAVPGQHARPTSRTRVEVVASRSVAFGGLLFAAQTFPVMLGQIPLLQPSWSWFYNAIIFGGLLLGFMASIFRRFVRSANTVIAAAFLVAMATWPLAVLDPDAVEGERPWLWFLCTIATAAAAMAFTRWWAAVYLLVTPAVYGIVRLTPSGGAAPWDLAALDTVYAILLGGAVLVIVTLLRDAAASSDAAQATALARYAHAVRQHATEVERVQVDSLVHDSVLTTLISAARAFSPEAMALSARMARDAIGHLEAAATTPDAESLVLVRVEEVAERIAQAAAALSSSFTIRVADVGAGTVSSRVAEALQYAATQAMTNSLQHAGSSETIRRWLRVVGVGADGLDIEIGDTGAGFEVDAVPPGRIGLRISIVERVTNAGGEAIVVSHPGEGAVVQLRWPAPGPLGEGVPR